MESIYHMVVTLLSMQCLKVSLKLTVHYHKHWLGKVSSLFINWSFFICSSEMPQRFRCIKNSGKNRSAIKGQFLYFNLCLSKCKLR
jgi:hypothetical protein